MVRIQRSQGISRCQYSCATTAVPGTIVHEDPRAHSGQKLVSLPKTYGTNATSWATTPSLPEITINTPKRSQLPARPFKRRSFGHVWFRNVVCHNYRYF